MDVMLSDNAKRLLCRTAFILLCVIPTILSLKAALFPRSNQEWSASFQHDFGLINQIGEVQVKSPQRTDFIHLSLGTDRFQSRLEIDAASLQKLNDGKTLFIENAYGSVSAFWESMSRITETVAWSGKSDRPVKLYFGKITLVENEAPGAQTCVWNNMVISVTQRGRQMSASFVCDQHTDSWHPEATVSMERLLQNDSESWFVDGTGYRIPAWVLKHGVPSVSALNVTVELADAKANFVHRQGLWSGEIESCQLVDLDLNEVIGQRFGNALSGRAIVNLGPSSIRNNRIESLQGDIHCPSGKIGNRLLQASTVALGMELVEPHGQSVSPDQYGGLVREDFKDLRFGFKIQQDQVAIYGMESGAILNNIDGKRMLIAQHGQNWPTSSLVRLLNWPSDQINISSAVLANHLVMPPVTTNSAMPETRTARQNEVGYGTYFNR